MVTAALFSLLVHLSTWLYEILLATAHGAPNDVLVLLVAGGRVDEQHLASLRLVLTNLLNKSELTKQQQIVAKIFDPVRIQFW